MRPRHLYIPVRQRPPCATHRDNSEALPIRTAIAARNVRAMDGPNEPVRAHRREMVLGTFAETKVPRCAGATPSI